MVMTQRTVRRFLQFFTFQEFNAPHPSGRTQMIHDGIGFVESLRRNDVFVGDAFILVGRRCAVAMKPDVMFSRNLTESLIKWHVFFPLGCHPERQRDVAPITAGYAGTSRGRPATRRSRLREYSRTRSRVSESRSRF